MRFLTKTLVLVALATGGVAFGDELDEVVVTGSSVLLGYYEMPAITLKKEADFLLQQVRFLNDSRSPDLRKSEIVDSIAVFLASARRTNSIELSYGSEFLVPVDLDDDSIQLINDKKRVDTNYVDIYVKASVFGSPSIREQISALRSFISGQKLKGRTEIETLGDIGLSIVGPEQYRYEILKKITEENDRIREIVGDDCSITVGGLEGRVAWERSSGSELTLYIPYGTEVKCGS